jgi:hypothetical protein
MRLVFLAILFLRDDWYMCSVPTVLLDCGVNKWNYSSAFEQKQLHSPPIQASISWCRHSRDNDTWVSFSGGGGAHFFCGWSKKKKKTLFIMCYICLDCRGDFVLGWGHLHAYQLEFFPGEMQSRKCVTQTFPFIFWHLWLKLYTPIRTTGLKKVLRWNKLI